MSLYKKALIGFTAAGLLLVPACTDHGRGADEATASAPASECAEFDGPISTPQPLVRLAQTPDRVPAQAYINVSDAKLVDGGSAVCVSFTVTSADSVLRPRLNATVGLYNHQDEVDRQTLGKVTLTNITLPAEGRTEVVRVPFDTMPAECKATYAAVFYFGPDHIKDGKRQFGDQVSPGGLSGSYAHS